MQQLLTWTLDNIRAESCFSWMEKYRHEWSPLVKNAVAQTVDGKTTLIITDESFDWFGTYILKHINKMKSNRPLLPFYSLISSFPNLQSMDSATDIKLLEDILDISYPNGYYFWYIGRADHPFTKLAYENNNNFLWIMDKEIENSFMLRSADQLLDIKLLQLFQLFDNTLAAVLFGELDLKK